MDTTVVGPCFSLAIKAGGGENSKGNSTGVQAAHVLDAQSEVVVGFNHRDSTVLPGAMINFFSLLNPEMQIRSLRFEIRSHTCFLSVPVFDFLFALAGNRIVEQRKRRDSQTFGT